MARFGWKAGSPVRTCSDDDFDNRRGLRVTRVALIKSDEVSFGGTELVDAWRRDGSGLLWVDLHESTAEAESQSLMTFGIHPLAIQDALRDRHPPKLEVFDDYVFVLLKGLDADTHDIDFGVIQLAIFVGADYVITRHSKNSTSVNHVWSELESAGGVPSSPGTLALRLMRRLARRYVEILLALEHRLDEIEEEVFRHPRDSLLAELTQYKSRLRHLTRIARYHCQITDRLRRGNIHFFAEELFHEATDLHEQVERTQSLAELHYHVAGDLTDGYLALTSHRLNRVMQILTIITVIFVPLTFVAGIYGMNFEYMPELGTRNGYFVVLGVMLIIVVTQLVLFRRRRWI